MEAILKQVLGSITEEQISACEEALRQNRSEASARLIMIAFDQE